MSATLTSPWVPEAMVVKVSATPGTWRSRAVSFSTYWRVASRPVPVGSSAFTMNWLESCSFMNSSFT